MRVGFIGLGNMGQHMARNLLKGGRSVVVFDVQSAAVDRVKSAGATSATSPKLVAEQSDVIVTMLPSSPHVQEVYLGASGVAEGLKGKKPGAALCIDSSTIDPATARHVASSLKQIGAEAVDAPVSGGVGGAEAGTLTFMVGGTEDNFARAKPVLQLMGKNIVYCGGPGNGQVAKICNNLILAISMAGVSEAMQLGVSLGIDAKVKKKERWRRAGFYFFIPCFIG